jgi:hypothetical protein
MKQYLLLLRSSDFSKSGNIWTSNPINIYSNNSYTNYSYSRSAYGLDLIGDTVFTGTELTSPSFDGNHSTPYHEDARYKTDYGEIIPETATPSILRFVDMSSRADVISYRHLFTNLPGTIEPTFSIEIYESDDGDPDGPWLKSLITTDTNTLFLRNVKPYIKVVLEIETEEINLNTLGLIFYLEVLIHNPVSPIAGTSVRNILRRFPSWTDIFKDSVASTTPNSGLDSIDFFENLTNPRLHIPESTGGKFMTGLVQESLDDILGQINLNDINSYINSADINMLAWVHASYNVPPNMVTVIGDGVELSPIGSMLDFLRSRNEDYVYFYDAANRKFTTIRSFDTLLINGSVYEQDAENIFNDFDEFGARVSLPRLYLESNENYKKRILDVNQNVPQLNSEGFKRTLRRELDIWRVYGATPNSNYLGATPELLEISDIENSTPYFNDAGHPQQAFFDLVEKLNNQYPSNLGYVRWGEGIWDYAGKNGEGVGRIPAIYDTSASPLLEYYQSGVGDFNDAKLITQAGSGEDINFTGGIRVKGHRYSDNNLQYSYEPIKIDYSWYSSYIKSTPDYFAGRQKVDTVAYAIGDTGPGGGKIFITPSTAGNSTGKYFEAAPVAVEVTRTWATGGNQSAVVSGADGTAIGTGAQNTIDIVNQAGNVEATSAAVYCSELDFGGKSDWFLPSKDELQALWTSKNIIGGFSNYTYWSSSEADASNAWTTIFFPDGHPDDGLQQSDSSKSGSPKVRPIRSFVSTETYVVEGETIGVAVAYEIVMPPHDNYATPSTFYTNLNYLNRDDFYVGNRFNENSSASPEYNYITIFDQDGNSLSAIQFKDKVYNQRYLNTQATPSTNSINVFDAEEIRVVFNTEYSSPSYQVVSVAPYRASFSLATPAYNVEPANNEYMLIASPNINNLNANLLIGSTIYESSSSTFNTDTYYSSVYVNNVNDITSNGLQSATINTDELIAPILYPVGATPQTIYLNVNTIDTLPIFNFATPDIDTLSIEIGGQSRDANTKIDYVIPSSPNIVYRYYDSNNSASGSYEYFEEATINYDTNLKYMEIETPYNTTQYPFSRYVYYPFNYNAPELFSGLIDNNNNTYLNESEKINYFISNDHYLNDIILSGETFDLDPDYTHIFRSVELHATPDIVVPFFENTYSITNSLTSYIAENELLNVPLFAKRKDEIENYYSVGLNSGWVYLNEKDYYIYSNPSEDSATGSFFSIDLSATPRMAAPTIVKVGDKNYRNVVFEDAATPGKTTFSNVEILQPSKLGMFYTAYENISKASVKDIYTGNILFENLSSNTNILNPFSSATPSVANRDYEISYTVNDAFYVEKDYYDENEDINRSIIYFSSTPSSSEIYSIIYEKDIIDNFLEIDLDIDQVNNPLQNGYVYISKNDYPFSRVTTNLSPKTLTSNSDDLMYLSIISYDENNNLKPGQTFYIHGDAIQAVPEYVTTNDNGYGLSVVRFNPLIQEFEENQLIRIDGVGSATPNGGQNSETGSYSYVESFKLKTNPKFNLNIKASSTSLKYEADGTSYVEIVGRIYWQDQPLELSVELAWAKAETLYDLFDDGIQTYSISTDSSGRFVISREILAGNRNDPNNWFVKIEIANEQDLRTELENLFGELSLLDVTISGDIVYWHESYNFIDYANEEAPINNNVIFSKQMGSDIVATPYFAYDYVTSSVINTYHSTPSWKPPKWVLLRRFDQYQMGLLGSTPDYIDNYTEIHPDNEDM